MSLPHLLRTTRCRSISDSLIGLCLVLAALAGGDLLAQETASGGFYPDRILVKLHEESGAVLEADGLGSRNGSDLAAVLALFDQAAEVERCIDQPLEVLDQWYREAEQLLPEDMNRPGHLGLWFRLRLADPAMMPGMLAQLRAEGWIEEVQQELVPVLASVEVTGPEDDIAPATPDLRFLQGYVQDAPVGLGFDSARRIAGARGQAQRLYHVETAWRVDHEDLPSMGVDSFLTDRVVDPLRGAIEHGTTVLGVWVGGRNGFGVRGVVDAAEVRLVSQDLVGGIANGVAMVIADSRPGDLLALILGYNIKQVDQQDMVPAEYTRLDFDVILTAVSRGVTVVEAAGNGDSDLDDPRFTLRFDRSFRDSGAIMVGATDMSHGKRAVFSNYGSRVDCNAWGEQVGSLGHGTWLVLGGDARQRYTERGAGTSAATALIAGLAVQVAGAVRLQDDRVLTPLEIRNLVSTRGTAVPGGQIGIRPDAPSMLAALGLPDGLDVARHEVLIGESVELTIDGPVDGLAILGASFGWDSVDLGPGRHLLLDLASLNLIGGFALSGGQARWTLDVPAWPGLRGVQLFFQARLMGAQVDRLSSSVELFVGYQ